MLKEKNLSLIEDLGILARHVILHMEFPPGPRIVPIEESLEHWLIRTENEARRETNQQVRQHETKQEEGT
jgi:hypothetical protein